MMLLLLSGCGVTVTHIAVTGSSSTTVEAGTVIEDLVGDLGFGEFVSMDLTKAQELQNQGVAPADISSAVLTDFTLTATSGEPDLSFFSAMDLTVEAEPYDVLRVAWSESFAEGSATVDFKTTGADIREYVTSQSMTLTADATAHRPEEDTEVRGDWTVDVGVTTEGAVSNL